MEVLKDWLVTFGRIASKPLPQTFIAESGKAKGKLPSAIAWIIIVSLASDVQNFLVNKFFSLTIIVKSILFMPIVALFFVFCVHRLYQKLFGRKKNHYDELLYLTVGSYVPFVLISIFIVLIPGVGKILFRITMNYPLILVVIAVKTITKLKVWQSIVVVGLGALLAVVGSLIIPLFITSILHTTSVMF